MVEPGMKKILILDQLPLLRLPIRQRIPYYLIDRSSWKVFLTQRIFYHGDTPCYFVPSLPTGPKDSFGSGRRVSVVNSPS
jgi:hypothetical protein